MNRLKLFGYALIASSFYFLWVYVVALFVLVYNLAMGHGTGLDIGGVDGLLPFFTRFLFGAVPLGGGIYLVTRK